MTNSEELSEGQWFSDWPKDKFTLYLAHASASRKDVRKWELEFEKRHPEVALVNPFYDVGGPGGREDVRLADEGGTPVIYNNHATKVVMRDLAVMNRCNGILAIIDHSLSIGMPQEIVYAHFKNKKPRIALCTNGLHTNPWLNFHMLNVFSSEEALDKEIELIVKEIKNKL